MSEIRGFFGENRWLSNFWLASFSVDDILYRSMEHYYQASKAKNRDDLLYVAGSDTPGVAKARGRRLHVREDWNEVRLNVMRKGLRAKFEQNPELREKLLATGNAELIEENTWGDKFWGKCNGDGHNHLGEMLMELRDSFRMDEFYG